MGIADGLKQLRLRLKGAWQGWRTQGLPARPEDTPTLELQNPDMKDLHVQARRRLTEVMSDETIEQQLVEDIRRQAAEQHGAFDEANRGPNGQDRIDEGGDDV